MRPASAEYWALMGLSSASFMVFIPPFGRQRPESNDAITLLTLQQL